MAEAPHDFSGIGPECDCPAEPYTHRHIGGSQPVAEADDAMRRALATALEPVHLCDNAGTFTDEQELAVTLAPTVRALIADELRAAADQMPDDRAALWLRARADALDPR